MSGLLSVEHIVALVTIAVVVAIAVVAARKTQGAWIQGLAAVLIADEVSWWIYLLAGGQPGSQLARSLPLQLCDIGIFVAAFSLWSRIAWLVDLTYFWGLTGTLQALLTPDLPQHFPSYPYFQYYIAHGGVVVAALVLVIGLRLRPGPLGAVRAAGLTIICAALVGVVDAATGANYMYLRSKPPTPTLLDVMGPWPWYILSEVAVGALLFALLAAPFLLIRPGRLLTATATHDELRLKPPF